jgi:cytochrome c-type biogenesis protein CcmH
MAKFTFKNQSLFIISAFIFSLHLVSSTLNSFSESIDNQVMEISSQLMCPVCMGQSVSESNAQLAKDMRTTIRKQLEQGKTKNEILQYFVNRYGETILSSPPARGFNILIWVLPTLGIILFGLILGNFVYRSKVQNKNKLIKDGINDSEFTDIEYDLKKYDL